jgi:hypothetical protein
LLNLSGFLSIDSRRANMFRATACLRIKKRILVGEIKPRLSGLSRE